jgi:hypothetical protein
MFKQGGTQLSAVAFLESASEYSFTDVLGAPSTLDNFLLEDITCSEYTLQWHRYRE